MVALGLVYALAYLIVLSVDTGSRLAVVCDDLGNLVSPLVAATACVLAARRGQGRLRVSWALFGAFAAVWALGQLAWVWYEVVRDVTVPFPGLPDVGYVASVPFVLAALLAHPDAPRFASGALRLTVDGLIVGASLLALSWRIALGDAYRDAGAHGLAQLLGLGYPVLDVVVVTFVVLLATRARGRENRPFVWVAACLSAGAAGHLVYGVLAQSGTWQAGNPVDAAWGVGFLFLAVGAMLEEGAPRPAVVERPASTRTALLPYVPVVLLFGTAAWNGFEGVASDTVSRALGAVLLVAVLVRQALSSLENSRLNRSLEQTVATRTRELMATTAVLERQAWSDALTGLPNRTRFFDACADALGSGRPLAVALLDLDGFKSVNDSQGHAAGDEILVSVGRALVQCLPEGALVARLGGDEFAFLLPDCADPAAAEDFGRAVLEGLSRPVLVGTRTAVPTGSIGVVLACEGDSPDDLLRNADVAMYAAKDAGKSRVRLFEPVMHDNVLARVAMEADLRAALVAGEVIPWFQPIVHLDSGAVVGVEALARWDRDGVAVPPGVFIPLAEECGLVPQLGRSVLRRACSVAAGWTGLTLTVNVSAAQLADDDLVDVVREALLTSRLAADRLVLEITETAIVEEIEAVIPRLAALRALGVRIALDDFGTGYSALGYLQQLPVDILKIDRAFVRDVHKGPRQSALAAAVMTLAASLDLEVVAEGIELEEQAARLRALCCSLGQGFLYAPAVPAEELPDVRAKMHPETVSGFTF